MFDKDGNDKISIDELSAVMETAGFIPTEAEVQEMMKAIDTDGKFELFYKFAGVLLLYLYFHKTC